MATYHRSRSAPGDQRFVTAKAGGTCAHVPCKVRLRVDGTLGTEATLYVPGAVNSMNRLCGTCAADWLHNDATQVKLWRPLLDARSKPDYDREIDPRSFKGDGWKWAVSGSVYGEPSYHSKKVAREAAEVWLNGLVAKGKNNDTRRAAKKRSARDPLISWTPDRVSAQHVARDAARKQQDVATQERREVLRSEQAVLEARREAALVASTRAKRADREARIRAYAG